MPKLIAASAALMIAMSPTFAMAQNKLSGPVSEPVVAPVDEDVVLIGPGVDNTAAYIAGGAGLIALGLLLGSGGGSSTTTTTTSDDG